MKLLISGGDAPKEEVGGKAKKLLELKNHGFKVPDFVVFTTAAHREYLTNNKLSRSVLKQLEGNLEKWDSSTLAIRSSMSAEDGANQSYAGMMESYLHVLPKDAEKFIYKCFESVNSDRVRMYDHKNDTANDQQGAAVIVQVMVDSDASGVAFSRSPVNNSSLVRIEAGYGIGEGIVSGIVEVDSYEVNRFGQIVSKNIAKKETAVRFNPEKDGEKISVTSIDPTKMESPCLTDTQIHELYLQILEIEAKLGFPVDVEWAIKNNKIFILQARPITQSFSDINYYIDTNLSESYPGKIARASGDFVTRAYETVFRKSFVALNYSSDNMDYLSPKLKKLVRYIDGHMYYDLSSYYETLAMLPGGKKNIENWHKMIGGDFETCVNTVGFRNPNFKQNVLTSLQILKFFLFHDRIFNRVQKDITRQSENYEKLLAEDFTIDRSLNFIDMMERETLGFGEAAINDLLIMISMKIINKILTKHSIDGAYLPGLIKTEEGVDSLKPLIDLDRLVENLRREPTYFENFSYIIKAGVKFNEKDPYAEIFSKLQDYPILNAQISDYLEEHGDRSFEELKLECLTLKQSPKNFLDLLSFKYKSKSEVKEYSSKLSVLDRSQIPYFDRKILNIAIHYSHKTIKMREQTRLLRGQLYGRARRALIKGFADIQKKSKTLSHYKIEDFFHVSLCEYRKFADKELAEEDLKKIIDRELQKDLNKDYPEHFSISSDVLEPKIETNAEIVSNFIDGKAQGLGASTGEIIGEALILFDPKDAMQIEDLSNKILVTKTTDPAWVFIMSQCKGLISEKALY